MSLDIPDMDTQPNLGLDPAFLLRLANAKMPFGKYAGRLLIDLPEPYVVWFSHKGYPRGEIGELLQALYTIKENGLELLLRPLVESRYR